MHKTLLILFIGMSAFTFANSYRTFTDIKGKTFNARIIKVDYKYDKVVLELENKKKSKIRIENFSEEDMVYIYSWEPHRSTEAYGSTFTELTTAEVKKIARIYEDAWDSRDYAMIVNMFLQEKGTPTPSELEKFANNYNYRVKAISTDKAKIFGFETRYMIDVSWDSKYPNIVRYPNRPSKRPHKERSFLTSAGKIKYESWIKPHPVDAACFALADFVTPKRDAVQEYELDILRNRYHLKERLLKAGIPIFNLSSCERNKRAVKKEVEKIIDWLEENGTSFDASEPEVFYPQELFKDIQIQLKRIRQKLHSA